MKRLVFVLSGLLVLPAFAEVAPIYYDDAMEFADAEIVADDDAVVAEESEETAVAAPVVQPSRVNPRSGAIAGGRVASRVVPSVTSGQNQRVAAGRVTATSRATKNAVQARSATPRSATRSVRSATGAANQIATTRRETQTNGNVAARASIVQTDTVNTPLYTGRVSTRTSGAIRARIPTITSTSGTTSVSVAETKAADAASSMDELAQLTDFCKAQYTSCMDNFCNVLDDNQGRCSCSKNIKNYAKTEAALKEATEALKDVAQQIQYIGLTSDEVETLFSQTEAELAMNSASDNSQIKNDLDKIKNLIVDVKSGTASSATDTGLSFDLSGLLDFSIDSTGFDLSALFGGNQTNTNSISNQRGEQLYKTAAARCKAAVLTDCQKQGVDISVITNSYDLEIDKQCIAYERQLTDTNDEMSQTVRNAKSVLQRARLLVAQQKNAYDLRGCISALDSCMQDDYVCGTDYEYCLDPTGKYIVNGEIVVGSTPGFEVSGSAVNAPSADYSNNTLYSTWLYGDSNDKTPWAGTTTNGTLAEYITKTVSGNPTTNDTNMSKFLQYKIGYNDGDKNHGMCMSVLNKCQDLTYENGSYNPANNVIKMYLERALVQIKTQQDTILADYAENCISDVTSCLSSNGYDASASASTSKQNIAINACHSQIKTCMSVNGASYGTPDPIVMQGWVGTLIGCGSENAYYNTSTRKCETCQENQKWNYEDNKCEAKGS